MSATNMVRCESPHCRYPNCGCADVARDLATGIADLNTRRIKRVDAGVNVLFALALGTAAGLLIAFELGGWPW